ncbi:ATP-dependent DNA ligase [Egibacter rhizosphaerae]|uniref:DNA ligase (ATP) n=2 Tax=Egibacter rhizosphaerae TaxID=1670831 RepID=A0A411YLU0_9ACTN|nr:ATP-dependent DNA ligase [Egibacter rhizosphaerae]
MEARVRASLPTDAGWAYEPKWDGFRALAWAGRIDDVPSDPGAERAHAGTADGAARLDSRSQRPLRRYFPELDAGLAQLPPGTVVDGEVIVTIGGGLDFDALQARLHPAASRVARLAAETPAALVAFDLLADRGADVREEPFAARRERLEELAATLTAPWHLTPSTRDPQVAREWFERFESAGCDGIVAKRLDDAYHSGVRAMTKVKHRRHVACVVGGYREHKEGGRIGSLLLGLRTDGGDLHFIGHCSGFPDGERARLLTELEPLIDREAGFGADARQPGQESRWTGDRDLSFVPLRPERVAEVSYDQLTGDRFRHATRFERWRPDLDPASCTLAQLERPEGPTVEEILGLDPGRITRA